MHETLSAGFGRAKPIQTSEGDSNSPQNVIPKPILNSYLCCQTSHRGLESSHLCCPGAIPLTAWIQSGGGRRYQESPCNQICLCCCSLSCLGEKLSKLGSATDPRGHQDQPQPLCVLPCLQQAKKTCHLLLLNALTSSYVWLNLPMSRRPMLKISSLCFSVTTISVYS